MEYFDGVIVVEGKGDVSFLSSFIDSEYVILNGYDMPEQTIDYLKHINGRKIIVLTDPDEAGFSIEKRLKETGLTYEYKKVDPNKCNKHGKHGVAECEKNEILRIMKEDLIKNSPFKQSISKSEFNSYGLMESQKKRDEIAEKLHLGFCNSKTLFKRMNYNGITVDDLEKAYGNK